MSTIPESPAPAATAKEDTTVALLAYITPLLGLVSLVIFVFWIIGIINAINGREKPLPLVGEYYQKWFATAFV